MEKKPELVIIRSDDNFQGFTLNVRGFNSEDQTLCLINGNRVDFKGAVVLLEIDQYALYGLSNPPVISRVLSNPPQVLLTTKELAHRLFEHGMKASLGKVLVNHHWYLTNIDSFYSVQNSLNPLGLHIIGEGQKPVLKVLVPGYKPVWMGMRSNINCGYPELHVLDDIRGLVRIPLVPAALDPQ